MDVVTIEFSGSPNCTIKKIGKYILRLNTHRKITKICDVLIKYSQYSKYCSKYRTISCSENECSGFKTSCWLLAILCLILQPQRLQPTRLLCPLFPGVGSNSCTLNRWCYLTISSTAAPFSYCLWSFPVSGSFPVSWLFTSGGQRIGASASASVLPMNMQGWFPLGLTGLISLVSKGFSRVSSSTTI